MLVPLAGLVMGIIIVVLGVPVIASLCLGFIGTLIYLFISYRSKNPVKAFKLNYLNFIWIFLLFLSIGSLSAFIQKYDELQDLDSYIACKGSIVDIVETTSGDKSVVKVKELITKDGHTVKFSNLKLLVRTDAIAADVDDCIAFPLSLMEIEDSKNYFNSGYADAMRKKGIFYQCYVDGSKVNKYSTTHTFNGLALQCRDYLTSFIEKTPLNKATQNFLITILLGDRSYLDPDLRKNFADAGISHILALSGMHIAIIGGIFLWVLFPFNFFGKYRLRYIITVVLTFIYAFISGWNPSTVRAALMMSAIVLCILLERKNSSWNSLLLAVFIFLIINPYAIFDIGLQLSFLCVASLIFFVNSLNPFGQHDHPNLYRISTLLLTTVAATLGTWVVVAYYFGNVPVVFLPANLIILPLLPIYLILAIIFIILTAVGIRLIFLANILDYGFNAMTRIVGYITAEGQSALNFCPSLFSVAIWLGLTVALALLLNGNLKRLHGKWISAILFIFFVISVSFTSEAETEDGFIIQNGIGNVNILSRTSGKDTLYKLEKKAVSEINILGHSILSIDGSINYHPSLMAEYDEVIISGGCKEEIIEILSDLNTKKVIIHPSVRKKRESQIIQVIDSLGIEYHSIRNSGPYKVIK